MKEAETESRVKMATNVDLMVLTYIIYKSFNIFILDFIYFYTEECSILVSGAPGKAVMEAPTHSI